VIGRVLVIEDDPASLELMFYLLSAHGYVTTTAARGDDGLAAIRSQRPDLVICDIQLPGLDGYAVAAQVKADEMLRTVPLVAVTALAMVGDRERVLAAGFDAYVSKPIDPSTFVSEVEPLLKPELRRQLPPPAPLSVVEAPSVPQRATIVVVDDTPENLELARSILEPCGYAVLTAGTVRAGMKLIRAHTPALIISDVGLPDASGLELLRTIKADPKLGSIPVLVITATHGDAPTRESAMRLGAWRFLIRPLEALDMLHEVEACLAAPSPVGHSGKDPGR
jgi:two-component system, cell cycle response regulator